MNRVNSINFNDMTQIFWDIKTIHSYMFLYLITACFIRITVSLLCRLQAESKKQVPINPGLISEGRRNCSILVRQNVLSTSLHVRQNKSWYHRTFFQTSISTSHKIAIYSYSMIPSYLFLWIGSLEIIKRRKKIKLISRQLIITFFKCFIAYFIFLLYCYIL